MGNSSFFDESREQSSVKAEIVAKYFWAWAKVVIQTAKKRQTNIAYVDLELECQILTEPSKRRKNTFGDKVKVTFPPRD